MTLNESAVLSMLEEAVRLQKNIPPKLREALMLLLDSPIPIISVKELAIRTKSDRTTLYRQWRNTFARALEMSLKDLIDWILLLRAMSWRLTGASWSSVAYRAGIKRQTLSRIARRLVARELRDLEMEHLLRHPFVESVLPPNDI